jgi:hypothetical protein
MAKNPPSLAGEVVQCCRRDRLNAESASIAYYFFLSFFPMILTLFGLTGLIGRQAAFEWVMEELLVALPPTAAEAIGHFVLQVTNSPNPSALSIGVLLTVWTASNVFAALADGLNKAYEVKRAYRWWQKRLLSLAMLLLLAVALVAQDQVAGNDRPVGTDDVVRLFHPAQPRSESIQALDSGGCRHGDLPLGSGDHRLSSVSRQYRSLQRRLRRRRWHGGTAHLALSDRHGDLDRW